MEYLQDGHSWSRYEQAYWETLLQFTQLLNKTEQISQKRSITELLTMVLQERLTLASVMNDSFFETCDLYWWLSKIRATQVKLPEQGLNYLKFRYALLAS